MGLRKDDGELGKGSLLVEGLEVEEAEGNTGRGEEEELEEKEVEASTGDRNHPLALAMLYKKI